MTTNYSNNITEDGKIYVICEDSITSLYHNYLMQEFEKNQIHNTKILMKSEAGRLPLIYRDSAINVTVNQDASDKDSAIIKSILKENFPFATKVFNVEQINNTIHAHVF